MFSQMHACLVDWLSAKILSNLFNLKPRFAPHSNLFIDNDPEDVTTDYKLHRLRI